MLGALSQITSKIKLAFGVSLMPHEFIHPARVAEKMATLDVLSSGRAVWGMGRSTPMEQLAFGVDIAKSKDKMKRRCTQRRGHVGRRILRRTFGVSRLSKTHGHAKAMADPHPPAWMAASTESSAVMAGENGCGLLCFSIMQPLSKPEPVIDAYRKAQETRRPAHQRPHQQGRHLYARALRGIARPDFEANKVWESMWWWYKGLAEFHLKWEMAHLPPEAQDSRLPADGKASARRFRHHPIRPRGHGVVGTPDECFKKFLRYEEAGVDQLLCYLNFGYLPHESVMKSIELLGKHVIPELAKRGANRTAASVTNAVRQAEKSNA